MKHLSKFFILLSLLISNSFLAKAQNLDKILKVTYKIKIESNEDNKIVKKHDEFIKNLLKAYSEMEFDLISDYQSAIYQISKKLELGESNVIYEMAKNHGGGNTLYYRNKEIKLRQVKSLGVKLNVISELNEYNWEITKEKREIGGFVCYKAIGYKEQFDKSRNKLLTFSPIAWFAPEINAPFGPKGIDGLPGLVLEGSINGKLFFYASSINLKTDEKHDEIVKPKGGRNISENEYLDLLEKKRSVRK